MFLLTFTPCACAEVAGASAVTQSWPPGGGGFGRPQWRSCPEAATPYHAQLGVSIVPHQRKHVVLVGGGIFGATSAVELRRRGWDVTLVDPGPLPHEAASSTDVSKVVRMDYGSDLFYHELGSAAMEGWDQWNAEWPRPLFHQDGFLILSPRPMAPGGFERDSYDVLVERGFAPERLGPDVLRGRFPEWVAEEYPDGYLNARAGWAESGAVVAYLLGEATAAGVRILPAGMTTLLRDGPRVAGIRTTSGEEVRAERVVVCAGAWTATLLPWLSDLLWATGQRVVHLGVDDPERFRGAAFPPWAADISGSGWYGFPALDDGRVKVAHHGKGFRVDPASPGTVSDDHVERVRSFLRRAIPSLADAPVVHRRVCMYCDSFDGDFLVDRDPERPGLVVASGGSGHAFKFAPLLGGMVADVVEGESNRWLSRFLWRERSVLRTEEARFDGA